MSTGSRASEASPGAAPSRARRRSRRNSILSQFLIEAVVISLIGGIAGIGLGIGGGNIVAMMLNAGAVIPWGWTIAGMLFCAGIGVTFGFYPAWKAARLDPIEALRFE